MHHELTELETKLAALALNDGAPQGEWQAAALKFFRALRNRHVKIGELQLPSHLVIPIRGGRLTVSELRDLVNRLGSCPICHRKIHEHSN